MSRAYATSLLAALAVATGACGVDGVGPGDPDARVGDSDAPPGQPDANVTPTSGLSFTFRSYPVALPTDPDGGNKIVIEDARMWLRNVRAVGDAAPGDERTTIESVILGYNPGEPGGGTLQLDFPRAPAGVYSLLIAEVTRYELEGSVEVGGDDFDYSIDVELSPGQTVNIDLKGQVLGSELLTVPIKSDLRKLPREIDWNNADQEDGEIEVESSDPGVSDMNGKLSEVHKLDD